MKKKPEQYTRAGKSNVTLRNFLNNLKENDLHFENNQITQCVFLGVLRLKPVPTIFSSNNTSSDCSSVVESKPRRFRNNNSNKEGNKNISRKKDINKVISGKIRKKNPEKIKASVKKVPVKKPIIKVKLNMKKKTPNSSPSKESSAPSSDLIEADTALKLPSSPPMFNPIDNLFSKLKQQIEHSQPGPSGALPQEFVHASGQSSVCKINVNRQLRYPMNSRKSKKLNKKRSIIHERLAMPLLSGGQESIFSSDSSGFKEDLTSSSSHTSGSPDSEQDATTATADVIVVTAEVPKVSKQKERSSPRNKGAANDEEVFWIDDKPDSDNLVGSEVIVIPDNLAEVPCGNSSRNNVIVIDETRGPRLSPRSKKTNERTQETKHSEPNINTRPSSKQTTTQSGEKLGSGFSTHSLIFDVEKTDEKPTSTLLKTVEPALESEKSFDKPRRRRRLMPTAIPSIFFNTPMLLRSELAQKKPSGPEKKPVARGLPRLLRSELNKPEKPPKARNSSSQTAEPQKNYKQNDNLIYEVVKPAGVTSGHTSTLSESSSSSGNEVICLDDAPPKVEPLIIKLKKNFETSPNAKGEAAKEKRNSYDSSASISVVPERSLLKPQTVPLEDTKSKESGLLSPKWKSDTEQLKPVKPKIPAEKTTVLSVKNFETLSIDTSNRKSSPKVPFPKNTVAMVSPKPVEINLVQEEKQEAEVPTKNADTKQSLPEKVAVKVSPKPVEDKVQKAIEFDNSGNEKNIGIVKLRENTRKSLKPTREVQKNIDPHVILISDETQTSSDCIDITDELPSRREADVVCQTPKESAKSKYLKVFPRNRLPNKNDADQELSHIKAAPEVIDLCSTDPTDAKDPKKSSELEKRITIHSDFKLQFLKNEDSQSTIDDGDEDKNGNSRDDINANAEDKNASSKDSSKTVGSKNNIENFVGKDSKKTVDLTGKSSELEEVIFVPKTTRSSVAKEQLVAPKTELTDENIEAVKQLAEKVKTEELDTVDLASENIPEKESKRTLRSEMVQQKSALPPVKTAEIEKPTEGRFAQKSLRMPEVTKTSPIKPPEVGTLKLSEVTVVSTVMSAKIVERTMLSNKRGSREPEGADLPQRLLRSDRGQQKLSEDKNKNILQDSKIKTPKSNSSRLAKKNTAQPDLNTELSKKIYQDIETLQNDTDKESSKNDRSRSSVGQKSQKKDNLDEIIVLGEKKAKKTRESTTRLLRSSLIDSEPTTIKSEKEKVVVLVHDEPKGKQIVADTANMKEKCKGGLLMPRSLRSQKRIKDLLPVKINSRKGRKPVLSVGKKSSVQDNKLKTANKNKSSSKTLGVGVVKESKRSKAPRVLTKNGASVEGKKKIPVTKKVTRQKISQPLGRLRQRAVANVPKKQCPPAKAEKLQKQVVAKNKISQKGKKSVEWKNNEIIEKIIQEIRNTIFQGDNVEDNLQLEEGNVSSEENSPKENIVPAKKKTAGTGEVVSDKKKKVRRASLKEIRNTKNTRANHQRGHYKTRQGNQNAKSDPKPKALKKNVAETTSKRASQRVAQKLTKEDPAPIDPSLTTVDPKEEEIEVPNDFEPKKESVPCTALDEASDADDKLKNISNDKGTYQMVNNYLEEIEIIGVGDEENKNYQLKRKSEDLEHEVVARKQFKMILGVMQQSLPQLSQDEAAVTKAEATDSKDKTAVPKAVATVPKNVATVSKAIATVPKAVTTVPKAVATVAKAMATVSKAEATLYKAGGTLRKAVPTVSKAEATVSKAVATASKAVATVPTAEASSRKAEPTVSKAVSTVSKAETTLYKSGGILRKGSPTVSKAEVTISKAVATVPKPVTTVPKAEASVRKAEPTVSKAEATVLQAEVGAVGKATKRRYTKRTSIKSVKESPVVDVEQSGSQFNKMEEDSPANTIDGQQGNSKNTLNGEGSQSVQTDEVKQDDGQVEAKKQCKTEFVRILEKLVKEMLPTEDLQQSRPDLDDNAKMANVIRRLREDNEERQVQRTPDMADGSSKKADITVFDFDESEPEVTPLRHKASPEKPTVASKDKMWSRIEQPTKEAAKKTQRRPKIKEESAKTHDEPQSGTDIESEVPMKLWSRIEQPKKAPRRPNINEEHVKARDESRTSSSAELEAPKKLWSRIEVPTELQLPPAPRNNPRKSVEVVEAAEDPQDSPAKVTSPMKQPTIIEMFNKVRLKLEQGGAATESVEGSPAADRPAAVAARSRVSVEQADFGAMPPPKTERPNCKAESMEDDDSDCESRAEWIPEEYAEYKMKYSAQKMMQYKPVFKCKVCLKVLPSYYRLTKHRKEHELRDNPYVCRECEADFGNIDELTAHLRVHKGKFPYTCSKCSVGFWTKKAFDAHAPVHVLRKLKPPVKKFRCDVCAKEFSKLCDIDRHMRVHTGEKPCICNICNKGFQQSHNLSKHLLTHLHIRPFHCEICDKQFGRGDVLARHVLTHSIDKPIKCWVCHKGFIRQTQLAQHHHKYHRDQPAVKPEPEEGAEVEEVA